MTCSPLPRERPTLVASIPAKDNAASHAAGAARSARFESVTTSADRHDDPDHVRSSASRTNRPNSSVPPEVTRISYDRVPNSTLMRDPGAAELVCIAATQGDIGAKVIGKPSVILASQADAKEAGYTYSIEGIKSGANECGGWIICHAWCGVTLPSRADALGLAGRQRVKSENQIRDEIRCSRSTWSREHGQEQA